MSKKAWWLYDTLFHGECQSAENFRYLDKLYNSLQELVQEVCVRYTGG
ncbi:MAG: hypothetical protein J6R59_11085 [Paludibacteraceae bacterium]|nr:hypothetical protein [Paludibacteraceae bacterium]